MLASCISSTQIVQNALTWTKLGYINFDKPSRPGLGSSSPMLEYRALWVLVAVEIVSLVLYFVFSICFAWVPAIRSCKSGIVSMVNGTARLCGTVLYCCKLCTGAQCSQTCSGAGLLYCVVTLHGCLTGIKDNLLQPRLFVLHLCVVKLLDKCLSVRVPLYLVIASVTNTVMFSAIGVMQRARRTRTAFLVWIITLILVCSAWFKVFTISSLLNKLQYQGKWCSADPNLGLKYTFKSGQVRPINDQHQSLCISKCISAMAPTAVPVSDVTYMMCLMKLDGSVVAVAPKTMQSPCLHFDFAPVLHIQSLSGQPSTPFCVLHPCVLCATWLTPGD